MRNGYTDRQQSSVITVDYVCLKLLASLMASIYQGAKCFTAKTKSNAGKVMEVKHYRAEIKYIQVMPKRRLLIKVINGLVNGKKVCL